ncbi:MAG: hypothetical protein HLUCCO02_07690 [Idiomarinaceae bacterium HL-53]|nr:MAG: hypothetical protein HLUCCO02_07690 [Idiomarinaceae bacterium HL-53]CUS47147.1 hypothetical protein Ga0003345_0073 [Idiomarinaceae bacterium HL-53]
MYFSTKNIPELAELSPRERIAAVHEAARNMPFARRALAVTLKALVLIALFWSLLYIPGIGWKLLCLLIAGLLYPLLLFPITLNLARPYLGKSGQTSV